MKGMISERFINYNGGFGCWSAGFNEPALPEGWAKVGNEFHKKTRPDAATSQAQGKRTEIIITEEKEDGNGIR